jgi:putative transposase
MDTIKFYKTLNPPARYSKFLQLPAKQRADFWKEVKNKRDTDSLVDLLCYCLMPNHFHFLLKQNTTDGILNFVRKFQISYTKYFNTKHNRLGPLLQGQFKAVRIQDENQLVHVSRYIHLNPYTSYVVSSLGRLMKYGWSSLSEYTKKREDLCSTALVLSNFKSKRSYAEFVFNQADYQRKLAEIKHLVSE